jgi:NadR type nicotinamide-nucleotide adenylyltransferase
MGSNTLAGGSVKNRAKPLIVVVTGAESTGKSTLTCQLAHHYASPWYPEYAREYLEKKGPSYTRQDVEKIARKQLSQMKEAISLNSRLVFFDTWMIVTKVWMEIVYGESPHWIADAIRNAPVTLFLLCNTELPWILDPLRENGGEMREKLSQIYIANMEQFGFLYRIIKGSGQERVNHAVQFINEIL